MSNSSASAVIKPVKLTARCHAFWLSLPKWFRIGCWAVLANVSIYMLIAIRIAIGLIESPEIQRIRQEGGIVLYPWREHPQLFRGYHTFLDGLWGRSTRNVHAVIMPKKNADNINRCLSEFPNLRVVVVTDVPIQVNEWFYPTFCLMMMQNHATPPPVVIGYGNEYGKSGWKRLDKRQNK